MMQKMRGTTQSGSCGPSKVNPKAAAWDEIGGLFWSLGRKSARPSEVEIDLFLQEISSEMRVAVVGASTKELIEAAAARAAAVTVIDFSEKMCADLREVIPAAKVDIRVGDITQSPEAALIKAFDYVLADRLINRFTRQEATSAFVNMALLSKKGGRIRTSVKLGLYDMDIRMIEEGERRGVLSRFFDSDTKTIDFSAAGTLLDELLMPHGEIPKDALLSWYRGRGKETRFEREDIVAILENDVAHICPLTIESTFPLPDAPRTEAFTVKLT